MKFSLKIAYFYNLIYECKNRIKNFEVINEEKKKQDKNKNYQKNFQINSKKRKMQGVHYYIVHVLLDYKQYWMIKQIFFISKKKII